MEVEETDHRSNLVTCVKHQMATGHVGWTKEKREVGVSGQGCVAQFV